MKVAEMNFFSREGRAQRSEKLKTALEEDVCHPTIFSIVIRPKVVLSTTFRKYLQTSFCGSWFISFHSQRPKSKLDRISDVRLSTGLKQHISNRMSEIQTYSCTSLDHYIHKNFLSYKTTYASRTSLDFGCRGWEIVSGNGRHSRSDFGIVWISAFHCITKMNKNKLFHQINTHYLAYKK